MKKLNIILAGVIALAEMVIGTRGELPKALKENVREADKAERASDNGFDDPGRLPDEKK